MSDTENLNDSDKELLIKALNFYKAKIEKLATQAENAGLTATCKSLGDALEKVETLKTKIL